LRGLLGHIAALGDQFGEAACTTRADERLDLRLRNPRDGGATKGTLSQFYGPRVLYGAMARVLDVERALRARPAYNGATGRACIAITDDQIPESSGPWAISFEEGRVTVGSAGWAMLDARTDIGTFTQLYFNFATATEARAVGLLEADDATVALLDHAFAGPRPELMDYF
jgi:hypothetical protein